MNEDKTEGNEDENGEESDNVEDENDNDEDEDDEDEYSDLEESEDEKEPVTPQKPKQNQQKSKQTAAHINDEEAVAEEKMKKEIPFTFTVPTTFEALQELFEDRTAKEQVLIIERMIQCNHPQFGNDNKSRLEDLFRFLLQYIHDSACLGTYYFFNYIENNYYLLE